jgi:hypothetical protein
MPANDLVRDGLLPRSSAPQPLRHFLIARFGDSFTVVLDDLLLLCVNWKVFRFQRLVVGHWRNSLVARTNRCFGLGFIVT